MRGDFSFIEYPFLVIAGGIIPLTKVSEPAVPNSNCSSNRWASFSLARFFGRVHGPARSLDKLPSEWATE